MTIAEQIENLRTSLPGCSLVAFGDAKAQLILRSSQRQAIHREQLDQLCEEAADCFTLMAIATEYCGLSDGSSAKKHDAIVMTNSDAKIFVKTNQNEADFLCLVCDLPFDPDAVTASALNTLNEIAANQ